MLIRAENVQVLCTGHAHCYSIIQVSKYKGIQMKKTVTAALLIGLLGTGVIYAHGNEKHENVSQTMMKGTAEMSSGLPGKNMTPQKRKMQMKKMQDKVMAIMEQEVKKDLNKSLSTKAISAIRTRLEILMKEMQKKMMQENGKLEKEKMMM